MFFDLILRNSKRNRKENGLFFSSLIISVVAFYIILSISNQDIMHFLQEMESDAVNRLMQLIPVLYILTLIILFFLIYFACKYQLQRRKHEFGMYLMLGMRRSRLFFMLLAEDFVSSIMALVIGLPASVLLSEIISIVTAKLVGMGIVGHRFSVSGPAVFFTIVGFIVIKLLAFLILSGRISRQEIGSLLSPASENAKKQRHICVYILSAVCGILFLAVAYTIAIKGYAWQSSAFMLLTLLSGVAGTILLFYGMRILISLFIKLGKSNLQLRIFNFRQIQENVIQQSTSLAISSLLILAALCCFGAGIGVYSTVTGIYTHTLDYTFISTVFDPNANPDTIFNDVQTMLKDSGLEKHFSDLFQIRVGSVRTTDEYEGVFKMDTVIDSVEKLPPSNEQEILINNLTYAGNPNLISLSDYNNMLEICGKPTLKLASDEAVMYHCYEDDEAEKILNEIIATHPKTELDGNTIYLTGEVQTMPLATVSSVGYFALILPDEQFFYYTQGDYEVYVNGILCGDQVDKEGLMNAYSSINAKLDSMDMEAMELEYESYLQNIGKQLFFMVAASYITSYLAIIFLVVSNTIIGVQFLMNQQRTGHRYRTLVRLGATYETLRKSARKQIFWFMGLPVFVAVISSSFGVKALFRGLLSSETANHQGKMFVVSVIIVLVLCIVEFIYMTVIKRCSDRYLLSLLQPKREE